MHPLYDETACAQVLVESFVVRRISLSTLLNMNGVLCCAVMLPGCVLVLRSVYGWIQLSGANESAAGAGLILFCAAAFAAWGMVTGVAVLRRKTWACQSMLRLALAVFAAAALATAGSIATSPLNAGRLIGSGVGLLLGLWWFLLFQSARVKAEFAGRSSADPASPGFR